MRMAINNLNGNGNGKQQHTQTLIQLAKSAKTKRIQFECKKMECISLYVSTVHIQHIIMKQYAKTASILDLVE